MRSQNDSQNQRANPLLKSGSEHPSGTNELWETKGDAKYCCMSTEKKRDTDQGFNLIQLSQDGSGPEGSVHVSNRSIEKEFRSMRAEIWATGNLIIHGQSI